MEVGGLATTGTTFSLSPQPVNPTTMIATSDITRLICVNFAITSVLVIHLTKIV
jgi:hypothetical protein